MQEMQEMWVWPLAWENPTCHRATEPIGHNYWAYVLRAWEPKLLSPHAIALKPVHPKACTSQEKPLQWEAWASQLERRPACCNQRKAHAQRPSTVKNKYVKKKKTKKEWGLPQWLRVKEFAYSAETLGDTGPIPGSGRSPGGGHRQTTPAFLPGESDEQRSLAGYSPWGCKESDTTKRLSTHLMLGWSLDISDKKRNEILIHGITWMILKNTILKKKRS